MAYNKSLLLLILVSFVLFPIVYIFFFNFFYINKSTFLIVMIIFFNQIKDDCIKLIRGNFKSHILEKKTRLKMI